MDQTTQQNAAMVEESTAAAASLAEQAGRLRGLVAAFRLAQGKLQAEGLRQTAAVMARAAAPARPVPAASRAPARPVVQGNLARKADEWEEF